MIILPSLIYLMGLFSPGFQATIPKEEITLRPLNETNGVLFVERGKVVFTSTAWQLVFTLNYSSVQQDINSIGKIIDRVAENVGNEVDLKMVIKANHSYYRMVMEFNELTEGEMENPKPIKKRSLDPLSWITGAFGSIAREIFGVASDAEVKKIEAYLKMIDQEREKLATYRKIQVTAIKIMEGQIERQRQQIQHLTNITELLLTHVLPTKENRKTLSSNLLLIYGEIDNMIASLQQLIASLHDAIKGIGLGKLSRQLFPKAELHKAIGHIQEKMPYNTRPVYDAETGLEQYYNNPLVMKLPGQHMLRGILRIPLQTTDQLFTLYEAIPFPMQMPSDPNHRVILKGYPRKIATTANHKRFLDLAQWNPTGTCLPSQPMVCPVKQATQIGMGQDCLFQLLGAADQLQKTTCQYETVNPDYESVVSVNERDWAVSVGKPIPLEVGCMDPEDPSKPVETTRMKTLNGNQILTIPSACTAIIGTHVIPLRLKVASAQDSTFNLIRAPQMNDDLKTEIDSMASERVYQKLFFQAYSQISKLKLDLNVDRDNQKVYHMVKQMSTINEEVAKLQPLWATHYFNLGIWPVILVILVVYLMYKTRCLFNCMMCAKTRNSNQPAERVPMSEIVYRAAAPMPVEMISEPRRRDPIYE